MAEAVIGVATMLYHFWFYTDLDLWYERESFLIENPEARRKYLQGRYQFETLIPQGEEPEAVMNEEDNLNEW